MHINEFVVLHETNDGGLLFNPRNGAVYKVNMTGRIIWQTLMANKQTLDNCLRDAVTALCAHYGENAPEPEVLAREINNFMAALAVKKFIYDCPVNTADVALVSRKEPIFSDRPLYMLSSMLRVFTPGDALVLKDTPFERLQVGDVIGFQRTGESSGIVHRIIARTGEELTTMGDNNPAADRKKVSRDNLPKLVVAKISPDGTRHKVSGGKAGMVQFRINRMRRMAHRLQGTLIRPLFPLMFWRIIPEDIVVRGDTVMFYQRRSLVAKRDLLGTVYASPWLKLRYKLPDTTMERKQ